MSPRKLLYGMPVRKQTNIDRGEMSTFPRSILAGIDVPHILLGPELLVHQDLRLGTWSTESLSRLDAIVPCCMWGFQNVYPLSVLDFEDTAQGEVDKLS